MDRPFALPAAHAMPFVPYHSTTAISESAQEFPVPMWLGRGLVSVGGSPDQPLGWNQSLIDQGVIQEPKSLPFGPTQNVNLEYEKLD